MVRAPKLPNAIPIQWLSVHVHAIEPTGQHLGRPMQQWIEAHPDRIDETLPPEMLEQPVCCVRPRDRRQHEERMIVHAQGIPREFKRPEGNETLIIDRDASERWMIVGSGRVLPRATRDLGKPRALDREGRITADQVQPSPEFRILGAEKDLGLGPRITVHMTNRRGWDRFDGRLEGSSD